KLEDTKLEINFGSQIRRYGIAPYRLIKDHRTKLAIGDVDRVLDGDIDALIHASLVWRKTGKTAGDDKEELPEEQARDRSADRGEPGARRRVDQTRQAGRVSDGDRVRPGSECAGCGGRRADLRSEGEAAGQPTHRACFRRGDGAIHRCRLAPDGAKASRALLARAADARVEKSSGHFRSGHRWTRFGRGADAGAIDRN